MEQTGKRRMSTIMPQVQANRRFGRYKKGQHKMVRGIGMADDDDLRRAIRAWNSSEFGHFENVRKLILDADFSPEDIQRFCVSVMDFKGEDELDFSIKLGFQVSAMIDSSSHGRFVLSLEHLETLTSSLCENNRKHVTIRGDVGHYLGCRMRSGTIHLEGRANQCLGLDMEGGRIIVSGDAGVDLGRGMSGGLIVIKGDVGGENPWENRGTGQWMSGGTIIIDGDAKGSIGEEMRGGEIHLNGKCYHIRQEKIIKGRIYHKGKLIVDK
jgi:hypothetical protein